MKLTLVWALLKEEEKQRNKILMRHLKWKNWWIEWHLTATSLSWITVCETTDIAQYASPDMSHRRIHFRCWDPTHVSCLLWNISPDIWCFSFWQIKFLWLFSFERTSNLERIMQINILSYMWTAIADLVINALHTRQCDLGTHRMSLLELPLSGSKAKEEVEHMHMAKEGRRELYTAAIVDSEGRRNWKQDFSWQRI